MSHRLPGRARPPLPLALAALVALAACVERRPPGRAAGDASAPGEAAHPADTVERAAPAGAGAPAEGRKGPEPGARPARPLPESFAMDAARPLRISWPLDVGPDSPGPGGRRCLRARQGANEVQASGEGWALYGFRVPRRGIYRSHLRVRWLHDGIGGVDCNNSLFVAGSGIRGQS